MKLPNWFRVVWWVVLLVILTIAVSMRIEEFMKGTLVPIDALILIIWFVLALVPIFKDIKLPGVDLKQHDPKELQVVEIHGPNGEIWTMAEDGSLTGFPQGSKILKRPYPDACIYPVDRQRD